MTHTRGKRRLGPRAARAVNIYMLADQPAAEAHPHGQVTQYTVLIFCRVLAVKIRQHSILAISLDNQGIGDLSALAHTAGGVKLNRPAQRCGKIRTVEHAQQDKPGGSHRRLHVGHYTA